jgi:hypothetical protein
MFVNYLSERKKSFRFFSIKGFWTVRKSKEAHLILHLRGNFEPHDYKDFYTSEIKHLLVGPFTYFMTPRVPDLADEETQRVVDFIEGFFPKSEQVEISKFLFRDLEQEG